MRLWYHKFGDDIDTLTVYMRTTTNGQPILLYTRFGQVGDYWERADIVIDSDEDFQVRGVKFHGTVPRVAYHGVLGYILGIFGQLMQISCLDMCNLTSYLM